MINFIKELIDHIIKLVNNPFFFMLVFYIFYSNQIMRQMRKDHKQNLDDIYKIVDKWKQAYHELRTEMDKLDNHTHIVIIDTEKPEDKKSSDLKIIK